MIDLLFALLNLSIVVFLIGYVFKRSMPTIKSALEAEIELEKELHNEHHQLLISQNHVEESMVMQEEECDRLSDKINQWKLAMESVAQVHEAVIHFDKQELDKKLAMQSERYRLHTMYDKLSPTVVEELETSLTAYYKDEKRAHAYIDRCIEGLKK